MKNLKFKLVEVDYTRPYGEQLDCKRHIIGAYANLARHNMTLAVNTIMRAVGMESFDENEIGNAFGTTHRKKLAQLDNIQKVHLQKRLYRHFTFLKRLKLEDRKKKSVQLDSIFEVLSDFTNTMVMLRNEYTHYCPYNSPEKIAEQLELKKRMGQRLTELFENSSKLFKTNEKLSHEENEVFCAQRTEVRYKYFWKSNDALPDRMTVENMVSNLRSEPARKKKIGNVEYFLNADSTITGVFDKNGRHFCYIWNSGDKFSSGNKAFQGKSYEELRRIVKDKIAQGQKRGNYQHSENHVRIDGCAFTLTDSSMNVEWTQFDRNPEYYASIKNDEKGLSDIGVIYFLCQFLDKSVAFDFMDDIGFSAQCTFDGKNAKENVMYLKEIMCMNRIRMVKMRLDSEMSETALALDMLGELRKCPKPLYEVLRRKTRDEFKDATTVQWELTNNREAVETEENGRDDENEAVETTVDKNIPRSTFVRWEDRFPYLALKYIDFKGLFDDIRFSLNLGKYRFAFYEHGENYSVDGVKRLRVLQKEMHGFGRIQEVGVEIKNKWGELYDEKFMQDGILQKKPDEAGQAPYVTIQSPRYAIDEKSRSIGMRWSGWTEGSHKSHYGDLDRKKMYIPYLPGKPKIDPELKKQVNQSEPLLPPQATLSIYELPGLLFYQYLLTKYGRDPHLAEQFIIDYHDHLKHFLTDVAEGRLKPLEEKTVDMETQSAIWEKRKEEMGVVLRKEYNLRVSDIPAKIMDLLCRKEKDYDEKLENAAFDRLDKKRQVVTKSLEIYRKKKERIGSKENKFDKMRATIKTGQLAQWLMHDILDWIPNDSECRKTLTGQSYMALQSGLTFLGQIFSNLERLPIELSTLRAMFMKANLVPAQGDGLKSSLHHPFLADVFDECKTSSVEVFYETYLMKELVHIDAVVKQLESGDSFDDYKKVPFLYCERKRWRKPGVATLSNLAKRYLMNPMQLPDGMFSKPIFNLLYENASVDMRKVLDDARTGPIEKRLDCNTAYLIRRYFEIEEKDGPQPFYDTSDTRYRHVYRLFKKYFGEPIPGTNQTTTPAYTVEEIREKQKIKKELIANYINADVRKFEEKNKRNLKKFEDKQWCLVKENNKDKVRRSYKEKEMEQEIKKRVARKKAEISAAVLQYENELKQKHGRMFNQINDNERQIRRFMTEDFMMLVMAREILKAKNNEDKDFITGFQLKNVMDESLLDKTVDFEWKINIKDKNNKVVPKIIEQKNMKIKNYGQFYKFASDRRRLESLLSRLPDTLFNRAEIENELSYYDYSRSEVFRQVYIIESEAYKLKPELMDDVNAQCEWFYYFEEKGGEQKKRYVRNSFIRLLEIVAAGKDGILNETEKCTLQKTRNAFGHNTYDVDLDIVFKGKEKKRKIPEIAHGIKDKIEQQTDELRSNLQ